MQLPFLVSIQDFQTEDESVGSITPHWFRPRKARHVVATWTGSTVVMVVGYGHGALSPRFKTGGRDDNNYHRHNNENKYNSKNNITFAFSHDDGDGDGNSTQRVQQFVYPSSGSLDIGLGQIMASSVFVDQLKQTKSVWLVGCFLMVVFLRRNRWVNWSWAIQCDVGLIWAGWKSWSYFLWSGVDWINIVSLMNRSFW